MSKITVALIIILCTFLAMLAYIIYNPKQNTFITTLTHLPATQSNITNTTLSFSPTEQYFQRGQTITVAILLHNPTPQLNLAQFELAYDPTVLTVDSLMPGSFFVNPTVDLQHIDPAIGRISYALHCSSTQSASSESCAELNSSTIAVITFTISPYTLKQVTTLSFLPKTVIRTRAGKDVLQETTSLQIPIAKSLYPIASSSAIMIQNTSLTHSPQAH